MHLEELDSGTIVRLRKQAEFLQRLYKAEFAKDPTSRATESSRSNAIALRDTLMQMYGDAALRLPALACVQPSETSSPLH